MESKLIYPCLQVQIAHTSVEAGKGGNAPLVAKVGPLRIVNTLSGATGVLIGTSKVLPVHRTQDTEYVASASLGRTKQRLPKLFQACPGGKFKEVMLNRSPLIVKFTCPYPANYFVAYDATGQYLLGDSDLEAVITIKSGRNLMVFLNPSETQSLQFNAQFAASPLDAQNHVWDVRYAIWGGCVQGEVIHGRVQIAHDYFREVPVPE